MTSVVTLAVFLVCECVFAAGAQWTRTAWDRQVEADWLRQAGTKDDRTKLRAATMRALELAEATLKLVERAAPRPNFAAEIERLKRKIAQAGDAADWKALYFEIRWVRRRLLMSHPVLDFERLLINKRPPPLIGVASHMCDQYLGRWSEPGPGLCILQSWRENPQCRELLKGKLPTGCVLHPDLSFDAKRVIFSFCDHTAPGLDVWRDRPDLQLTAMNPFRAAMFHQATPAARQRILGSKVVQHIIRAARRRFFIYELELETGRVRQLTGTADDPMTGWNGRQTALIEDFDPCYLPDGGFVFVSTRCQAYGRCHAGRYAPSYVLYRADRDGRNIERISFGEVNEWEPSVLPDGRIIFCRWDYINRNNQPFESLWACYPDGSKTVHFYGNYTRNPCMISEPRAIPGSHKVVATACGHHCYTAGSIIVINPLKGMDGQEPIERVTPEVPLPETEGWLRENYATPWPLSEHLFLVAYAPDPLGWGRPAPRPNGYGIYLIDTLGGRELIYRDPENSCFSPIPVHPRPVPPVIPSTVQRGTNEGVFIVLDVYRTRPDIAAGIHRGSVRELRVIRIYPQPTPGRAYSSAVAHEVVKGIVGTAPVEPDGSVAFRAPADVPLMFQLLDEHGMAVVTMRSQVWVRPGEVRGCIGCHEPRNTTSNIGGVRPKRIVRLKPPVGPKYEGGFSFARTVQPVLDRYCIRCHGLDETAGGINLLGTPTTRQYTGYQMGFNVAYESLIARPELIAHIDHGYNFRRAYRAWVDQRVGMGRLGAVSGALFRQYRQLAMLRAADRDGDGRLSRREAPQFVQDRFASIDLDGDGQIDRGELYQAVERLRGKPDPIHGRWVALLLTGIETILSTPRDYYAHASRLPYFLLNEHRQYVTLDRESFLRIVQWLDLNAQYYGDYSFNRPERRKPSESGERALRAQVRRQCGKCHATMASQPFAALVNIALPEESRLLKAPLAKRSGGWGQCEGVVWSDTNAHGYREMLSCVLRAVGPPGPRDVAGTCDREPCICGSCWIRKLGLNRHSHGQSAHE